MCHLRVGQPVVHGVDDTGAEEGRVVELEIAMTIERHDGEPVGAHQAQAGAECVSQAQCAHGVLAEGRRIAAVMNRGPCAVPLGGGQEQPRVDELLHCGSFTVATAAWSSGATCSLSRPYYLLEDSRATAL